MAMPEHEQKVDELLQAKAAGSSASSSSEQANSEEPKKDDKLPPLSVADFTAYNRMAVHMDAFHNHFRQTWNLLHSSVQSRSRPPSYTLRQFLSLARQFCSMLNKHHSIEEEYIFPVLNKRMPEFHPKNGILVKQHVEIHRGMDALDDYAAMCMAGETEFRWAEMGDRMSMEDGGWGKVLWEHLDLEVKALGAENMRKYWSKEEMKRLPM